MIFMTFLHFCGDYRKLWVGRFWDSDCGILGTLALKANKLGVEAEFRLSDLDDTTAVDWSKYKVFAIVSFSN